MTKVDPSYIKLTALITSQILHECLDELENTNFYNHKLKQITKRFQKELSVHCDKEINTIWALDEETCVTLDKSITNVIQYIYSNIDNIHLLNEFIENNQSKGS
jgi:superfamily I DNA and/or RNA helicase